MHKKNNSKKSQLGQFFTKKKIVEEMFSLTNKIKGNVLDPGCGEGIFSEYIFNLNEKLKTNFNLVSIEYDENICPKYAKNIDFFDYKTEKKFDLIIGNPPYVKSTQINTITKKKLNKKILNERANLFLHFIFKSFNLLKNGGELIFIVPRNIFFLDSARNLNKLMHENGTFAFIKNYSDIKIFEEADIDTVIFKYIKGDLSHVSNNKKQKCNNGIIQFIDAKKKYKKISDFFEVKVGAVSGMDSVFANEEYGNVNFVCSFTNKTGKTKKMIFNKKNDFLERQKNILLKRKVKKFNENNWWKWGRHHKISNEKRIYLTQRTRLEKPFFLNESIHYDGSVLALFLINQKHSIKTLLKMLNKQNWTELGFKSGGRFIFNPSSLQDSLIEFHEEY